MFGRATFTSDARFVHASFTRLAVFSHATFTGRAEFGLATFAGATEFDDVTLPSAHEGLDISVPWTDFSGARFARPVPPELARFVDSSAVEAETDGSSSATTTVAVDQVDTAPTSDAKRRKGRNKHGGR